MIMTDDNKLSKIEERAGDILKDHNGVYLDKRLYAALRKDFPTLSRKDFQEVLENILNNGYSCLLYTSPLFNIFSRTSWKSFRDKVGKSFLKAAYNLLSR